MLIRRSYLATGFKTCRKVNNLSKCEHVSVAVFSSKWCERRERQALKFVLQALWDVALFQLVKGDLPKENIA